MTDELQIWTEIRLQAITHIQHRNTVLCSFTSYPVSTLTHVLTKHHNAVNSSILKHLSILTTLYHTF